MDRSLFRIVVVLAATGVLVSAPKSAFGQEQEEAPQLYDDSGVWVYATFLKVPWSEVDSLLKLSRYAPAILEKGKEMGCYLDQEMLIHHTGTEYNVVYMTTYASFDDLGPGDDCGAFEAVVPDSTERAALDDGFEYVLDGYKHYDIIYWQPFRKSP
jgi:hypothetical protein